jgi:uncharacterized membrane protein
VELPYKEISGVQRLALIMAQWKYLLLVSVIIAVCAFLRFFMLTNQSLWFDEGWSLYYSGGNTFLESMRRITETITSERFQPLYFVILFFYRQAFGDSEFALRSLSAIFGVGAAIFLFLTVLFQFGRKRAVWSLMFFSASSYAVYYSQEVRPYALLMFFISVQLFLFVMMQHANESPHRALWPRLFGVITCLGVLGSIFTLAFTAALCLSDLMVYRGGKRWLKWWAKVGLLSLPALLYHVFFFVSSQYKGPHTTGLTQPIVENILFVPFGILVGQSFGPPMEMLRGVDRVQVVLTYWPELLLLFLVIATIGVTILLIIRKQVAASSSSRADHLFVYVSVLSFFLSAGIALLSKFNWQPRHGFFLVFPAVVVFSLAFDEPEKYGKGFVKVFRFGQVAIILLILLNLVSVFNYYFDKNYQRDDYRSVAQYLTTRSSIPSILLWGMPELLEYYGDAHTIDGRDLNRRNLSPQVREMTNTADTVFLAISREFYWGRTNAVRDAMDSLYSYVDRRSFPYFSIYTFVRKP